MYRVYCDRCGKQISNLNFQVNLDWNYYSGFHPKKKTYEFCRDCAEEIDSIVERELCVSSQLAIGLDMTAKQEVKD